MTVSSPQSTGAAQRWPTCRASDSYDQFDVNAKAERGHKKAWGTEHMSTLDTVNNLDMLYAGQGKMMEAEAMYMRALQGYECSGSRSPENASNRWQFKCIMQLVSKQVKTARV
jgi:predicted S18 family serine protease